jgi:hypothetical protein
MNLGNPVTTLSRATTFCETGECLKLTEYQIEFQSWKAHNMMLLSVKKAMWIKVGFRINSKYFTKLLLP